MSLESLLKSLQEAAHPPIWAKGVSLSRTRDLELEKDTPSELRARVRRRDRPVAAQVTLWLDEEDWYCDCGEPADPCPHAIAVALARKAGTLAPAPIGASSSQRRVAYRFKLLPEGLALERALWRKADSGSDSAGFPEEHRFRESLVSLVGGLHSGRLAGGEISATQADFAVDQILGTGFASIQALPEKILGELFQAMESLDLIWLKRGETEVQVKTSPRSSRLRVVLRDAPEGAWELVTESRTDLLTGGISFSGDFLSIAPHGAALRPWMRVYRASELPSLALEVLPRVRELAELSLETSRVPQVLSVPATLSIQNEALPGPALVVSARVLYGNPGEPPLADWDGREWRLLKRESEGSLTLPARDRRTEDALAQELQRALGWRLGEVKRFEGEAAIRVAESLNQASRSWNLASQAYQAFLPKAPLAPQLFWNEGGQFELQFSTEGQAPLPASSILEAWRRNQSTVPLLDGSLAWLPTDWLARFGERLSALLEARTGSRGEIAQKLPRYWEPELLALTEEAGLRAPVDLQRWKKLAQGFEGLPEVTLPADLQAELRPYQLQGVKWLSFLKSAGMGALLADDMGLGKTLQVLATLDATQDCPALIVCPTSVLQAWQEQLARFRPALRVSRYHGSSRELDAGASVTLTSYGVLRREATRLAKTAWKTIVLDEAQIIKNADTQLAQAAHALNAPYRVALSGTPIENRFSDLWSQFQFLNPGLLGDPPESSPAPEVWAELRRKVKPFILRRLKRDVAPELPPRIETVLRCELSREERDVYQALLVSTRAEVLRGLSEGTSVFSALEALLRLRQACCHPQLVPGTASGGTSSKLALCVETLEEAKASGRRTLVFSQWTSLLDLLEPELRSREIRFSRLDGATRNRDEIVTEFQSETGPEVMLLSLKAGGVGITLTAADHVLLLDPWWNPAVEAQAGDRAHRIGQKNSVLIQRLIAADTVEEKILELQNSKRALAEAILQTGDQDGGPALELTREDLLSLVQD